MNSITLRGIIKDIAYSHSINSMDFYKATLLVQDSSDMVPLRFKNKCPYQEGDYIELEGNIRSYTEKLENGRNKVNIYVFTYFNLPKNTETNYFELDGRVCKLDKIRSTKTGGQHMHLILANNIYGMGKGQKLNNYIPIVGYDDLAKQLSKCEISDKIKITGKFHSRPYIKSNDKAQIEYVAYEGIINSFEMEE